MARNSSGTYSLPAGNPVVSGTTISSTWANNTETDIASEITNSLDRQGRGAMSAPLQLSDGTVLAPGLTFGSDGDTGIYRIGANDLAITAGNTKVLELTSTTVTAPVGLVITQTTVNAAGVTIKGNGTGTGGQFLGGDTSGNGVEASGGIPNGVGLQATGTGTGAPVKLVGTNQASTAAYTNAIVTTSAIKAWSKFTLNNTASPTVNGGFNVTSVAATATKVTITLASAMATTAGTACFLTMGDNTLNLKAYADCASTTTIDIVIRNNTNTVQAPDGAVITTLIVYLQILGAQ